MIAELDGADDSRVRTYTWGLDLGNVAQPPSAGAGPANGRSIESAGGIGGLLATRDEDASASFVHFYDGNGNVTQMIDRSDDSTAAHYEYDAYANNLLDLADPNQSGPYAAENPIRFSTKWWDDETGLGYWGYRYYDGVRWLSRDPIGEDGGSNLYRSFANAATYVTDFHGARPVDQPIACCLFRDTEISGGPFAGGTAESGSCYKEKPCGLHQDPSTCCGCECSSQQRGPGANGSGAYWFKQRRLLGATRGKCCLCTVTIKRQSWGYWAPHHDLTIKCPHFTMRIDRFYAKNNWYGPAPVRKYGDAGNNPFVVVTKEIPCSAAEALREQLEKAYPSFDTGSGLDSEDECFPFEQCRSFAFRWYDAAGDGWKRCGR